MDFLLRARSPDDEEAEEEIRYNNLEQAVKRLMRMGAFTRGQFKAELEDARTKADDEIFKRRLMVIPYLIFGGLLTYYECSSALDYFEWLPLRVACYACLFFYPFYGIVYKRFTYDKWCIGWLTWNGPYLTYTIAFNFLFPPKKVQVSSPDSNLDAIILLAVIRSAFFLFTGEMVKNSWNYNAERSRYFENLKYYQAMHNYNERMSKKGKKKR